MVIIILKLMHVEDLTDYNTFMTYITQRRLPHVSLSIGRVAP
jgi:hypothetical protein